MTTIYFIRHATPDRTVGEDATFPLSEKGLTDVPLVTAYLQDKAIDIVLSSPFKRSYDTVADFAETAGLTIEVIDDFRERAISHERWIDDFATFSKEQWADFSYKLPDGECLADVQARNIAVLKDVLVRYKGKNIAVGTHGTALSLIIHYYSPAYGFKDFKAMASLMPWAVKMTFDENACTAIEKIDLFAQNEVNHV